jgi:AcrR family transcriptional regulator
VPRLIEATLAEHRAHQRGALLDAAFELLTVGGYAAMTFSALAARTGLARPSVYSYFPSRDDLAVAVCERELPRWLESVQASMDAVPDPVDKVAAYIRSQLELAAAGLHDLANVLGRAPLGSDARARIRAIHDRFGPKVADVLGDLGVSRPDEVAALVQGIVNAGLQRINGGDEPAPVIADAVQLALGGIERLRAARPDQPAG